jgi:hypothetical protein
MHPVLRGGLAAGFAGLGLLTLAACSVQQADAVTAPDPSETQSSANPTPESTSV